MEKKYSFVCDAANVSNSGNINVLGIFENINTLKLPLVYPKFFYVAKILFNQGETGAHRFSLNILNSRKVAIIPPLNGELNVSGDALTANLVLALNSIKFEEAKTYYVDLIIDNQLICSDSINIRLVNKNIN